VFSERKGLSDLFAAVDEWSRLSAVPWELSLAGQPQDPEGRCLVETLKQRYARHPWWPQVQWRGWVEDPQEYLAGLHLLICPSCEFEPFGLVVCEAALAGVPALATRQGGLAEIVQEGRTGWLFAPGDVTGAARLLAELLDHPDRLHETGARAAERVRQEFSITKMVAAYNNLYSTLV
jgi:glycosyltransferase involved in cell wall biosynthesis